jgi:hypothetical protein
MSTSERLSLFVFGSWSYVGTAVSGRGQFQDFRPGFRFSHICHVDRHGHFTLKQLRLHVLNETHTNIYTGPRLIIRTQISYIYKKLNTNSCFAKSRAISNLFSFFIHPACILVKSEIMA